MENRKLTTLPIPSLVTILDDSFQEAAEKYLSDSFPLRDKVVLSHAALQRTSIILSNALFHFAAYPTFLGSSRIFHEESRSLFELPYESTTRRINILRRNADSIVSLAQRHENLDFAVFFPDRSMSSLSNPFFKLVAEGMVDRRAYEENFLDIVSEHIPTGSHNFDTIDEWLEYYYATDHHWNIRGAYDGYREISALLELEPLENPIEETALKKDFIGSLNRLGLFLMEDREQLRDISFEYPDYKLTRSGKPFERDQGLHFSIEAGGFSVVTYDYFGGLSNLPFRYHAETNKGDGRLLLISNSYTNAIEPMLASHYEDMWVIHPISNKTVIDVDAFIKKQKITDVAVVLDATSIMSNRVYRLLEPKEK